MTAIHDMSAAELSKAYGAKKLSPVEATKAALARIDAWEKKINAMYIVDADGALAQAKQAEQRWASGKPLSPLDGVPITFKDNLLTKGMASPLGTAAADMSQSWNIDGPPVARIKEAGCVVLGKTTMPDIGMLASGVSSFHGITRNPWNTTRNSAGSSSGAGAALAAGYGPIALGTDIGGSVRLPAAYCGVFALKASQGRVPVYPPYFGRCTGPMTRTVMDAALLMDQLSLPDARDWMNIPYQKLNFAANLEADLKGKKLGLLLDIGIGTKPSPDVRAAIEAAGKLFEQAGATVELAKPFLTAAMLDGLNVFFATRAYTDYSALPPERQAKLLPFIVQWCARAKNLSAVEFMRGFNQVPLMREKAVYATEPYDYLLTPTSPITAYAAEEPCPGSDPNKPFEHICFTAPFNQSEQPAASINCGYDRDGLPIGLQIVGHRFDDLGVLRLARAFERLRAPQKPWPTP